MLGGHCPPPGPSHHKLGYFSRRLLSEGKSKLLPSLSSPLPIPLVGLADSRSHSPLADQRNQPPRSFFSFIIRRQGNRARRCPGVTFALRSIHPVGASPFIIILSDLREGSSRSLVARCLKEPPPRVLGHVHTASPDNLVITLFSLSFFPRSFVFRLEDGECETNIFNSCNIRFTGLLRSSGRREKTRLGLIIPEP